MLEEVLTSVIELVYYAGSCSCTRARGLLRGSGAFSAGLTGIGNSEQAFPTPSPSTAPVARPRTTTPANAQSP